MVSIMGTTINVTADQLQVGDTLSTGEKVEAVAIGCPPMARRVRVVFQYNGRNHLARYRKATVLEVIRHGLQRQLNQDNHTTSERST